MNEDKIIEQYVEKFGEMPPADMVISYYDEFYQKLMKKAIEENKIISPEVLEEAIGNQPYDYDPSQKNKTFEEINQKRIGANNRFAKFGK